VPAKAFPLSISGRVDDFLDAVPAEQIGFVTIRSKGSVLRREAGICVPEPLLHLLDVATGVEEQ